MELNVKKITVIEYLISTLLWIYIIYRSFFISITQDEAHSYLLVKTHNFSQMAGTANTHWLNTVFMRLILYLPGYDAVWKLRVLSMLSWPLFSWCIINLAEKFNNKWLGALFFSVNILNPFLILYFSLARGYAPALAFVALSLHLSSIQIRQKNFNPTKWLTAFIAAAVATWSNFSAFYFFLALVIFFVSKLFVLNEFRILLRPSSRKWWTVVAGTILFTTGVLFFLQSRHDLYYGGTQLIASNIGSLLQSSYYIDHHFERFKTEGVIALLSMEVPPIFKIIAIVLLIVLTISFLRVGKLFLGDRRWTFTLLAVSLSLLIFLINWLLHVVFNTPYLFARTALIIYPILAAALFFSIDTCWKFPRNHFLYYFAPLPFLFIIYNYLSSFSLVRFKEWPIQTETKSTLDFLQENNAKKVAFDTWNYSVLINYYSLAYPKQYSFHFSQIPKGSGKSELNSFFLQQYDYVVLTPPYDNDLIRKWRQVKALPYSRTLVLKNPNTSK